MFFHLFFTGKVHVIHTPVDIKSTFPHRVDNRVDNRLGTHSPPCSSPIFWTTRGFNTRVESANPRRIFHRIFHTPTRCAVHRSHHFSTAENSTATEKTLLCRTFRAIFQAAVYDRRIFHRFSTDFPSVSNNVLHCVNPKNYCQKKAIAFSTFSTPPITTTTGYVGYLRLRWLS